jgi:uncharacterized membrane protein
MKNKSLVGVVLAGILTAGAASAADMKTGAATDTMMKEKCYGIAMAGKNDCKAADASHSCKGQAKMDKNPNDFMLVADKAACTAAGGKDEAPKAEMKK